MNNVTYEIQATTLFGDFAIWDGEKYDFSSAGYEGYTNEKEALDAFNDATNSVERDDAIDKVPLIKTKVYEDGEVTSKTIKTQRF